VSRINDREMAVKLRLKGLSYSQIKQQVKVGNGTLSYWLKNYQLTKAQKDKLGENKDAQVEKFRETMKKKRELLESTERKIQLKKIGSLSKRDLMMIGVGLYWGEGKKLGSLVSVTNTDPAMIKFILFWLEECFGMDRKDKKIRIYTHLYSDMNIEKEVNYWREILDVNAAQFSKSYIKESKLSGLTYRGFGHGTCQIQVSDAKIKRQIMAWVQIFSDKG